MTTYTLWGFHPLYIGKDGKPYLIRLAIGTARACSSEARNRMRAGGWHVNTYRTGDAPSGLAEVLNKFLDAWERGVTPSEYASAVPAHKEA